MKKLQLILLIVGIANAIDIGSWQYGGIDIGSWQDTSGCVLPIISNPSNISDTVGDSGRVKLTITGDWDSLKFISKTDSMFFQNYISIDSFYYKINRIYTSFPCSIAVYNACGIDTAFFTLTGIWDTIAILSVYPDTGYYFDTMKVAVRARNIAGVDSFKLDGFSCIVTSFTYDTIKAIIPEGISIGSKACSICDTVSCDTTNDSIFIAGYHDSSTISLSQSLGGTISLNPPGGKYIVGASVTITATDTGQYHFLSWGSNIVDSIGNPLTYLVDENDITVSASFGLDTFYCVSDGDAHSVISYQGDSIAAYGETIRVYNTVDAGYTSTWPGGVVTTGLDSIDVFMTKDSTITAISTQIQLAIQYVGQDTVFATTRTSRDSCVITNGPVTGWITRYRRKE